MSDMYVYFETFRLAVMEIGKMENGIVNTTVYQHNKATRCIGLIVSHHLANISIIM